MFQNKLKELREKHGYASQKAFADAFGVAQSTVGGWESGKREPNYETTKKLAHFFDVPIDYLIGDSNLADTFLTDYQQIRLSEIFMLACEEKSVSEAYVVNRTKVYPYLFTRLYNRQLNSISKSDLFAVAEFLNVTNAVERILVEEPQFDDFTLAMHRDSKAFTEDEKKILLDMAKIFRERKNGKTN